MGLAQSLRAAADRFGGARDDYDDDYDYEDGFADETRYAAPARSGQDARPLALVRPRRVTFALVAPQDFDEAQQIADHLRAGAPVIVDLQECDRELSKRLTDFCSGLAYALEASVQYVGEHVVLLAPDGFEVSSTAPGALQERRFFNQL